MNAEQVNAELVTQSLAHLSLFRLLPRLGLDLLRLLAGHTRRLTRLLLHGLAQCGMGQASEYYST